MDISPADDELELPSVISPEFIDKMIARFCLNKRIKKEDALLIIDQVTMVLEKQPSLVEFELPKDTTLTICGDLHGESPLSIAIMGCFKRSYWIGYLERTAFRSG
jgi:hypothetical protein